MPNGGRALTIPHNGSGTTEDGRKVQVGLGNRAKFWPTPAGEHHGPDYQRRDTGAPNSNLETAVALWPTPKATDGDKAPNHFSRGPSNPSLPTAARTWTTPSASDDRRGGTITEAMSGTSLTQQVRALWGTPRIVTGSYTRDNGDPENARLTLEGQASFHPAPAIETDGAPSLSERRSLNPLFVEWLMGWPPLWVRVSMNCGCSATALSRFKQHMRGALSQLASHDDAPAQPSLFA